MNSDKGKLFLYSERQSTQLIKELMETRKKGFIDKLVSKNPSKILKVYENTYVLASSEDKFYNIFDGQTKNITRSFFNPQKKLIGKCQYPNCRNINLQTAHFLRDRPKLFKEAAKSSREGYIDGLIKYNVHNTMKLYLEGHNAKKAVCFLCQTHHNTLHRLEKSDPSGLKKFKKKISWKQ